MITRRGEPAQGRGQYLAALALLLAAGLLVRLAIAAVLLPDSGHRTDLSILVEWARALAAGGPGDFYRPDAGYFADYPPAYLAVLWLIGLAAGGPGDGIAGTAITPLLLKTPLIAADLAAGALLFLLVRRIAGERLALIGAALFLFNPAILVISTIWCQNDPIGVVAVLAAAWLLADHRFAPAAVAAALGLLVKFQYGFMVPIVTLVALRADLVGGTRGSFVAALRRSRFVRSTIAALAATLVVCLPFGLLPISADPARSLLQRLLGASSAFPGITQNAFNVWMNPISDVVRLGGSGLSEGHVIDDTIPLVTAGGFAINAQQLGLLLFGVAVILALTVLRQRSDPLAVCLVALTVAVAFFDLPTRIHERYLYPAVALSIPLLVGSVRSTDALPPGVMPLGRRGAWLAVFLLLSAVAFLDPWWVYTLPVGNVGPGRGPLADTVYGPLGIYTLALGVDLVLAWLLWQSVAAARGTAAPHGAVARPVRA